MNKNLLQKLRSWRREESNREGVELFRVFANEVLENIAEVKPTNKAELMAIKGIRDKKYAKYGEEILAIINGEEIVESSVGLSDKEAEKPLSVSAYLDFLNHQLRKCRARIQGEISSVDIHERVVYFSVKDSEDESVLNCLIWKNDYQLSGIDFEVGMEVVLEGIPDVYKPNGRLAFKTISAELVGEGALKKAYDNLKKKLSAEGLFLEERKNNIPELPQKIGLITSETGAVIHDFLTNLGRYGFKIKFVDSRVEGQAAVRDLMSAIDYFFSKDIDVLVVIRGGGSLESLQAFNNESLIRKISNFNKPVICGIGHDKDVPLASLAADKMVSTPTASAHVLNESWQRAIYLIGLNKERIFNSFDGMLSENIKDVNNFFQIIKDSFGLIFKNFNRAEESLRHSFVSMRLRILDIKRELVRYPGVFYLGLSRAISQTKQKVASLEKFMLTYNPERQLRLGYSIVRYGGKIVKSVGSVKTGKIVDIDLVDGGFESEVKSIHKK